MTEPLNNDPLRQIVREVREQEPAELDWDRLERRLMSRVDAEEGGARKRRWPLFAGLAAAAAIALGVGLSGTGPLERLESGATTPESAGPRIHTAAVLNGADVAVGDEVRALGQPSTVQHPGQASWTLHSGRAIVAESGSVITVRLVSGSIEAQVVPTSRPESFAVEVEGTRVAVHGTSFRVERLPEGVRVQVREGVVGVGPVAERGRPAWMLAPGDSGKFALDGRKGDVERAGQQPAGSTAVPHKPSQRLPSEPSAAEQAKLLEQLSAAARNCFESSTSAEKQVRVQAETTLSATIAPDGSLRSIAFDPPLSPAVAGCTAGAAKALKAAPTERGATISRSLLLGS